MRVIYFLFLITLMVSTFFLFGYMHEQVHVAIYNTYGIESKVSYFTSFPDFTTSVSYEDYERKCNDNCKFAHNINEAIGYPLAVITSILLILGFIIVIEFNHTQDMIKELIIKGNE